MSVDAFSISFMFEAILLSSILVAALAWISIRVARRIGLVDLPDSQPHKLHIIPTPLAGGLALFGGLLIRTWVFGTNRDPSVVAAFLAGSLVFLFGLWDDFKGISPLMKIIGQVLAVILLINSGVSIKVFESPEFFLGGGDPLHLYLDWLYFFFRRLGATDARFCTGCPGNRFPATRRQSILFLGGADHVIRCANF